MSKMLLYVTFAMFGGLSSEAGMKAMQAQLSFMRCHK